MKTEIVIPVLSLSYAVVALQAQIKSFWPNRSSPGSRMIIRDSIEAIRWLRSL